jgi:hypothetical protein
MISKYCPETNTCTRRVYLPASVQGGQTAGVEELSESSMISKIRGTGQPVKGCRLSGREQFQQWGRPYSEVPPAFLELPVCGDANTQPSSRPERGTPVSYTGGRGSDLITTETAILT